MFHFCPACLFLRPAHATDPATTKIFGFVCDGTTPAAVTVTATGGANAGDLLGKTVVASVNVTTGGIVDYCGTAPGLTACPVE